MHYAKWISNSRKLFPCIKFSSKLKTDRHLDLSFPLTRNSEMGLLHSTTCSRLQFLANSKSWFYDEVLHRIMLILLCAKEWSCFKLHLFQLLFVRVPGCSWPFVGYGRSLCPDFSQSTSSFLLLFTIQCLGSYFILLAKFTDWPLTEWKIM